MTASSSTARDALGEERRARARLDEILTSRQVVFVTGKGGVGKSVVAAACALRARALGLRPVLFECDAPTRVPLLPQGKPLGDDVAEVAPGILGINQKSEAAIRDYAAATLPSRALADLLFENKIARTFLQASPSVSEMALVGRIALVAEQFGADGPIIVDLHATGHALALLRAPGGIMKVLRGGGPLFDRARRIEEMLRDPVRTAFLAVAVPEELPVSELLELDAALGEIGAPQGPVILNSVVRAPVDGVSDPTIEQLASSTVRASPSARDVRALRHWARRASREETRLRDALAARHGRADIVTIRYFLDDGGDLLAGRIGEELARKLEEAP